jgi:oligopeptide/dipeptide ABC transporter ATP-binding protein
VQVLAMDLVLDDVKVVYRRGGVDTHAVRGVSLRVRRGETLAVVGESGSGKTTVAKVAAGLQRATAGTITWRSGPDVIPGGRDALRTGAPSQRVQMVFQHPVQSLNPMWKTRRAVHEPLRRRGVPRREAEVRVAELVRQVDLDESILDRYPRDISGGQAQRVAIARAMISNPDVIILDEPTASLDQTVRARILALLADLQSQTGVGYLMISHDMSSVRRLATRIAVMYRGLIVEHGPASYVLDRALHPYSRALIAAVPVADPRAPWDPARIRIGGGDGMFADADCPVAGSPCRQHGPGLHEVAPDHFVACLATARTDTEKAAQNP